MTILTEGRYRGEHIVSEANGTRSRETITLLSGQNLGAGSVLGQITSAVTATALAAVDNTGDGAMGAITVSAGAKVGDYKLTIIEAAANGGSFQVESPSGKVIGTGKVAVAFAKGGLAFTLADGATDFVAGDLFTITVAAGSGKYKQYNPANADGSETAAAVLYDNVDASLADVVCVIHARDAEVNGNGLQWFTGATTDQIATGEAELALKGIIAR